MGTNYYLLRKTEFDPDYTLPASLGCLDSELGDRPVELTNGWLWDKTYYPTLEKLKENYRQRIHIGKASCGWRFSLCVYPTENPHFVNNKHFHEYYLDKPISCLEDWIALFRDPQNIIKDEYGRVIEPEEMIEIICKREGFVEADDDGWTKRSEDCPTRYRVINGLCVHDESRDPYGSPQTIQIMPDDCTYDLIRSGNGNDDGQVFA